MLLEERPAVVVVTNPPPFAAMMAWLISRPWRARIVLDSHPIGFGAKDGAVWRRLQRLHRWLVRRSVAVLVTTEEWAQVVRAWGGTGIVLHEAPPSSPGLAALATGDGPVEARAHHPLRVLFVGTFAGDEPVDAVMDAAAMLWDDGVQISVTGDPTRWHGPVPSQVQMLGYLDEDAYANAMASADVVLALSTEPTSVMRAACEATFVRRVLVVSDTPASRSAFSHARLVANDAASLVRELRWVRDHFAALAAAAEGAQVAQHERWRSQSAAFFDVVTHSAVSRSQE